MKYTHIRNQRESDTKILDYQYIRPAFTGRKYTFSPSSHVEVMHEGSWWPCVIMGVLGSGIDKYVVKLPCYETKMDDVECLAMLTVENTQLRKQVRCNGKTWLFCSDEVPIATTYVTVSASCMLTQKQESSSQKKHLQTYQNLVRCRNFNWVNNTKS